MLRDPGFPCLWNVEAPAEVSCREPFSIFQSHSVVGFSLCHLCQTAAPGLDFSSAWLGNPLQMHPSLSPQLGSRCSLVTAAQTQVVPPVTSALVLDRPTITSGPHTICWVKGEEGPEGEEEEREGKRGGVRLRVALKFATVL